MLKPKYVHGLNADEAPNSLLHRIGKDEVLRATPFDDLGDKRDDDGGTPPNTWTWILG